MKKTISLKTAALQYKELSGFSVIPVGPDKRPLLRSWKEYQSRIATDEEIERWWSQFPDANVGIVTGKVSGITVVDVDVHKGASAGRFPKTYTVKTGNGGLQLYYKYHEGLTVSANAYADMPHVDLRNDGGFVVAPPSMTDYMEKGEKKGGRYEIIDAAPFADFPAALFPESKKKSGLGSRISVSAGSRNSSMASIIGTILLPMDDAKFMTDGWEAVQAINKTYSPPLSDRELASTFNSILNKEIERRANVGKATPSPIQISPTERIDLFLRKNGANIPYKDMTNALMVLEQHPDTKGQIRYNEFRQDIEYKGRPIDDGDILSLTFLMQKSAGLPNISKEAVYSAIQHYGNQNRYDEAADWLKSLSWDGTPRLCSWLIKATGVSDDADGYHSAVGAQWMAGLVRRLLNPGCIFDYVLVVVGPQGIGKTSLFRIIGGKWYKSFTGTVENKDFYLTLRGAAIIDLDEGVALYRSESIKMKSIITQTSDEYRAPYDRVTKKFPRRFVFSMSTNDSEPLRDLTGNRRYWIIDVEKGIDFKWLEENRDQIFAEAYHAVKNGTKLPEVSASIAEQKQEDHLPQDEWTEPIAGYVRSFVPYCKGDPGFELTIGEIYDKVLKGDRLERLERRHEIRIGNVLRKELGMKRERRRDGMNRVYRYVIDAPMRAKLSEHPIEPRAEREQREFENDVNKHFDI